MRGAIVFLLLLPCLAGADQSSFLGHWTGKIKPDRDYMMKDVRIPEHRKLLTYALARLEQSTVTLDLYSNGRFMYRFDDGYAADNYTLRGSWKTSPANLELLVDGQKDADLLPLSDGGKHFTTNYNDAKGVPIIFSHQ